MTIADGMHQIVDNINGARSARVSDIAELRSEVGAIRAGAQKDLKQINRTRRHNATAQKKTLHKYVKTLQHDSQDMLGMFEKERTLVQEDLAEAHAIWQNQGSGGHTRIKSPKRTAAKAAEVTQTPEEKADAALKNKRSSK